MVTQFWLWLTRRRCIGRYAWHCWHWQAMYTVPIACRRQQKQREIWACCRCGVTRTHRYVKDGGY